MQSSRLGFPLPVEGDDDDDDNRGDVAPPCGHDHDVLVVLPSFRPPLSVVAFQVPSKKCTHASEYSIRTDHRSETASTYF